MAAGRTRDVALVFAVAALAAGAERTARAQTLRDTVKQHVKENLEKPDDPPKTEEQKKQDEEERKRREAEEQARRDRAAEARRRHQAEMEARRRQAAGGQGDAGQTGVSGAGASGTGKTFSFSTDDRELARPTVDPGLPKRVIPDVAQIDFKLDAGYRGWLPQQYDLVDVDVAGYYTWSVDLRGKLFKYVNLHRGYYESNALAPPRTDKAAVAAQAGGYAPQAAWLLATLGFPLFRAWEPTVKYEARAFDTSASPRAPVCIVDRAATGELTACPRTTLPLHVISSFETLVLGVRYNQSGDPGAVIRTPRERIPPVFLGVGLMQYRKPYQVTIGGATLGEYLFDGRFRGAGLALGTNLGGGVRQLFLNANLQAGLGQVSLTDNLTLNELAPEDWLIGYVQGDLNLGYRFVLIDGPPTVMFTPQATAGGASFHFFSTKPEMGKEGEVPQLNWDFLWSVRAAIEAAF